MAKKPKKRPGWINALPNVFLVYQRRAHSFGYFHAERFMGREGSSRNHELALNPEELKKKAREFVAELAAAGAPSLMVERGSFEVRWPPGAWAVQGTLAPMVRTEQPWGSA